jgi:hypothetical protein
MTGIMAKVPYLPENEGQECGVRQLNPEIIYDHQKGEAEGQHTQSRKNFVAVVRWLLIQKPLLFNNPPQLRVMVGA